MKSFFNSAVNGKALLGSLLLAVSVTLLGACSEPEATSPSEDNNIQVEDLSEDTTALAGEIVSVRGDVAEIIDETAFLLDDDQLFGGEDVLVINASGEGLLLPEGEGAEIQVTGEVQQLVLAELETAYGLVLDPEVYADYEEKPVVIAESLALAPDPEEVTSDPELFYNQVIAVEGEVDDIYSPNAFTLDSEKLFGEEDLLVISLLGMEMIEDGETVVTTGTLRPYIKAEFERDYSFNWDTSVDTVVEAEYEQKPVLVLDNVYPSAED